MSSSHDVRAGGLTRSIIERIGFRSLLALMVPFFFLPPLTRSAWAPLVLGVLFTAILGAAALAVCRRRREVVVTVALAVVWMVELWSRTARSEGLLGATGTFAGVILNLGITALLLRRVLGYEQVTGDTIIGSLCVYLMMGVTFGLGYSLLEEIVPSSFAVAGVPYGEQLDASPRFDHRLFYFSFVTLTTLGYGDITPIAPLAQNLAVVEAICGVFYLAVLVSRLVSMHLAQRS